ncbi:hypothetical protein N658DRAFT_9968 [Parathielavia hyrcaniae]|uniref:Uncharacterized protein n=1 Tax=Parathielavia hyrcaniae TaxID=113614 RepID=A0AAN6T6T1_9PEZI|nr:hypothetical protein N658DRAFT_9968 [Parathielavia hyrcaniae]
MCVPLPRKRPDESSSAQHLPAQGGNDGHRIAQWPSVNGQPSRRHRDHPCRNANLRFESLQTDFHNGQGFRSQVDHRQKGRISDTVRYNTVQQGRVLTWQHAKHAVPASGCSAGRGLEVLNTDSSATSTSEELLRHRASDTCTYKVQLVICPQETDSTVWVLGIRGQKAPAAMSFLPQQGANLIDSPRR